MKSLVLFAAVAFLGAAALLLTIDPPPHSLVGSAAHPGAAGVIDPPPHSLVGSAAHPGAAGVIDPPPHSLVGSAAHPGAAGVIDRDRPDVAAHAAEPAPVPASPAARVPVRPPSTAPLPDLPKEGDPDVASAPSQRNADAEIAERRAQLQAQFDGQSVDPSWAMQSRQLLRNDVGKYANVDVRVRDVECRSSMCRIALASSSRTAQQSFIEDWIRHRTWTGSGFAVEDGDATIVYVSKPGVDLPN